MNEELFNNKGLFSPERLADLPSMPQWDCDEGATSARDILRDVFEKHLEFLENDGTEPQAKFFVVNPALHALGYVYSIAEHVPIQEEAKVRADYTLFGSARDFAEVEPVRGTASFFRRAIGLCQVAAWRESLEVSEDPEVAAQQPMVLMDLFLRSTGVDYGIVTNGSQWRLLHRGSSENLNTCLSVDVPALAHSDDLDSFKMFYILFGRESVVLNDEGTCLLNSFLKE